MRPLKLTMQAFGPYGETEVIDFSKLGTEQIFVISGKTGSGKTTIFDALSFALYGKTNTEDRDGKSLHSDFADEETLTKVDFVFSLKGREYRVSRSPIQTIQKKNGEGSRELPSEAHLYEVRDGVEHLIAQNPKEVDERLQEKIQLTNDQFRQILMLPQGEFRKLLISPSREKQVILQKLAHTEMYRVVEDKLKEKQQSLKGDIDKLQDEKMKYVQRVFPEITEEISANEIKTLFSDQKLAYQNTIKTLQDGLSVLERKIDNTQKDYYIVEAQLKEWNDLDILAEDIEGLNEVVSEYMDLEEKIKFAKKALSLKHFEVLNVEILRQQTEATAEVEKLESEIEALRTAFEQTEAALATHEEGMQEQKEREASYIRISDWEQKIKNLTEDYQLLSEFTKEVTVLEQERDEKIAQVAKVQDSKQKFSTEDETIRQAKLQEKDNESTLLRAEQEYNEFKAEQTHLQKREEINETLAQVEKELHEIVAETEVYQLEIKQMEANQKSYQAHSLAQNLHDGDACPVCGSTEHPQLAFVEGAEVETEHLEAKKAALQTLEQKKQTKKMDAERMLGQLEQLPKNIRNLDSVNSELARIENTMTKTKEQQIELKKIITQESNVMDNIAWINLELNGLDQALKLNQEYLMEKKGSVQQKQARIDMLTLEIPSKYRNLDTYYKELSTLKQAKEAFEMVHTDLVERNNQQRTQLKENEAAYNSATIVEKNAKLHAEKNITEYEEAVRAAGFASKAAYDEIKMTQEEIDTQEKDIQLFKQNVYHKTQKYEELKVRLAGKEQPDITEFSEELKMLQIQLQGDIVTISTTKLYLEQLETVENEYAQSIDEIEKAETYYMEVGELANSASGNNQRNVGFERYVLGSFLDTILAHANIILSQMTGGRFFLERKDEKAKHNAQSGLDLLIFDEYTGTRRDVTTLSGGESFKASLALALALAEVVQEQSGGISLDTMFIDEGFGTLDPESLDLAVEALLETQKNGRLIGIISHVPELKARVSAALQVTMTNTGSKTDIYIGGLKQ